MDICSHIGFSANKIKDLHGLSMNAPESTHGVLKVLSVDELGVDVTKFLKIQDAKEDDLSSSPPHQSCEFPEINMCEKSHLSQTMTPDPEKRISKSAIFSSSGMTLSPQDAISSELLIHGGNIKSLDPSSFRSSPMTTNMKPVSAMKGSREKRGVTPPVKLTVKWAPDVYDPIPTSVSHVATNNRSSRHSKKNSRNKQKSGSKSSKGSKGKEKKQVRKRGGNSSSMGYKLHEHEEEEEEMVDFRDNEPRAGGIDFRVGNPDHLCGSSFLKRYAKSLHLSSVAEAT